MTSDRTAAEAMTDEDYQALAAFRAGLREFLTFSESCARAAGITPQQHQLLIVLRAHTGPETLTIRELADALQIRHNSAVELVNRAADRGLLVRSSIPGDQRKVGITLTAQGKSLLRDLSQAHQVEIGRLRTLLDVWSDRLSERSVVETFPAIESASSAN